MTSLTSPLCRESSRHAHLLPTMTCGSATASDGVSTVPMTDNPTPPTSAGAPIADNQNSITAGPRGPLLMQDYQLLEKLAHQNRERIPERVVQAKGSAAYGTLTMTRDLTQ